MRTIALCLLLLAAACGDKKTTKQPTDTAKQKAALDDAACLALLQDSFVKAEELRGPAGAPEGEKPQAKGELIKLRGTGDSAVCIASRAMEWCTTDEPSDPECSEETATETVYVVGVIAAAKPQMTNMRGFLGRTGDNESSGMLAWEVIAIGPQRDALVLTSSSGSGDSTADHLIWLTVADGKLVEQLSYTTGYEDGVRDAEVEHRITDREANGYFAIELDIEMRSFDDGDGGDDDDDDDDEKPKIKGTDVCTFAPAESRYACKPGLIEKL